MHTTHRRRQAFTLVELAVVIGIISLLAAILIPSIYGAIGRAKEARIGIELASISQALERYKLEYGEYPPDFAELIAFPATGNLNPGGRAGRALEIIDGHLSRTHRRRQRDFFRTSGGDFHVAMLENLSPQNAIVFWLSGFTADPQVPLAGNSVRSPLFEFDRSRFLTLDDNAAPSSLTAVENVCVVKLGAATDGSEDDPDFAEVGPFVIDDPSDEPPDDGIENRFVVGYFPSGDSQKTPYIYYRAESYNNPDDFNNNSAVAWSQNVTWKQGDAVPAPYLSTTTKTAAGNFNFAAAEKFQLISAGRDGAYGGPTATDASGRLDNLCNFTEGQTIEDFLDAQGK